MGFIGLCGQGYRGMGLQGIYGSCEVVELQVRWL